jgi:hypothetical protein
LTQLELYGLPDPASHQPTRVGSASWQAQRPGTDFLVSYQASELLTRL